MNNELKYDDLGYPEKREILRGLASNPYVLDRLHKLTDQIYFLLTEIIDDFNKHNDLIGIKEMDLHFLILKSLIDKHAAYEIIIQNPGLIDAAIIGHNDLDPATMMMLFPNTSGNGQWLQIVDKKSLHYLNKVKTVEIKNPVLYVNPYANGESFIESLRIELNSLNLIEEVIVSSKFAGIDNNIDSAPYEQALKNKGLEDKKKFDEYAIRIAHTIAEDFKRTFDELTK